MAVDLWWETAVTVRTAARLIAVDGADGAAVAKAAHQALAAAGQQRGGISWWDASGLFEQLVVAERDAGLPSPRTLLLLYAADLAFRLRWEIEPALAEGKTVVAAQYVETAVAFGRASGLAGGWLSSLFSFAPTPDGRRHIHSAARRTATTAHGFVEFGCIQLAGRVLGLTRQQLATRTRARLKAAARR
jgi:hypothetical protein